MHILVEFKTRKEFDILCSHIQFKHNYDLEGIFKSHLHTCNGHSVAHIYNLVWENYNPYTMSGLGGSSDWSVQFNVCIFSISQFQEFVNTNPHLFI